MQQTKTQRKFIAADKIFRSSTGRKSLPIDRTDEVKPRSSQLHVLVPSSIDTVIDEEGPYLSNSSCQLVTKLENSELDASRETQSAAMVTALDITSSGDSQTEDVSTIHGRQPLELARVEIDEVDQSNQYEKIILNTSCVRRVGMGYQSNIGGPVESPPVKKRRSGLFFNTVRRPVSVVQAQAAHRRTASVDELGLMESTGVTCVQPVVDDAGNRQGSMGIVQRAVRAVLGATAHSRRRSRAF